MIQREDRRHCMACDGIGGRNPLDRRTKCNVCRGKGYWTSADIRRHHLRHPGLCQQSCGKHHRDPFTNALDPKVEVYISVDIEADGPIPGDYSMLSLGACVVGNTDKNCYFELKPISDKFVPEALAVSGLDRKKLKQSGWDPKQAMQFFDHWLYTVCNFDPKSYTPVFVGRNAPFDWMFVHWYFMHFLGENPFGNSALDIKAYYAGVAKIPRWADTSRSKMEKKGFRSKLKHTHNALDDAKEQAEVFEKLREAAGVR